MKYEWLKNESNYFVTCKYFRLILQLLQTARLFRLFRLFRRSEEVAGSTEST